MNVRTAGRTGAELVHVKSLSGAEQMTSEGLLQLLGRGDGPGGFYYSTKSIQHSIYR